MRYAQVWLSGSCVNSDFDLRSAGPVADAWRVALPRCCLPSYHCDLSTVARARKTSPLLARIAPQARPLRLKRISNRRCVAALSAQRRASWSWSGWVRREDVVPEVGANPETVVDGGWDHPGM